VPTLKKISIDDMAVAKAGRAIKKVEASKLPQVTLNVYAGKNFANDEVYDLGLKSANIYQVGLKSKWNMVDFGKRNLQIERAKILQMQSKLNRVKAIRELKKSIREAIAKIRESFALYRSSKSEFRLSRKTQRIEKERYESGVSTINDFLLSIAQKELARAKTIQSKYNYQKSIYYLDYILERGVK
jgi:outer membrane protein TolC